LAGTAYTDFNEFEGAGGDDTITGNGNTRIAFYNATGGVTVDLIAGHSFGTAPGDVANVGIDTFTLVNRVRGSEFNDLIRGDSAANTLEGRGGNDIIEGDAGDDMLDGGTGNDTASYQHATAPVTVSLALQGIAQNTIGAGTDTLINFENLRGSDLADTLTGNTGNNIIEGGPGDDVLDGGDGSDTASYEHATAAVTVSLVLQGNPQNTIGAGNDTLSNFENLRGSDFADTLTGNGSNNIIEGGLGNNILNGGSGNDTASYQHATAAVTVSLALQGSAQNTIGAGTDTLTNFENLRGSDFDDVLIGDASTNRLNGGPGADTLDGGGGFDYASYQNSSGGLTVSLADPSANTGEAAGDTYISIEGLIGSNFDDTLIGDSNNNWLAGGTGADALDGQAGFDYAAYFTAVAAVTASLANPGSNTGDAAGDSYLSIEGLVGSNLNDTLTGDGGNNGLLGGLGADTLAGGQGADAFLYTSTSDSRPGANQYDTIVDFSHVEGDKIDFSGIPGIATQTFQTTQLSTATSPVAANTVAWFQDAAHTETIVYVNTTSGAENAGSTNIEIHLTGLQSLTASDFTLHA
jgi:Ca2+-binding RTX toxin-like protein